MRTWSPNGDRPLKVRSIPVPVVTSANQNAARNGRQKCNQSERIYHPARGSARFDSNGVGKRPMLGGFSEIGTKFGFRLKNRDIGTGFDFLKKSGQSRFNRDGRQP